MPPPPGEPPLGVPSSIQFTNVETQTFAEADGGGLFRFDGSVVTQIDGDTSGVFTVQGMETLRLMRDPELPPGSPPVWTTIRTVDGAGPIDTRGAQALAVTVGFFAPDDTQQPSFSASAVVVAEGSTSPALKVIPLQATVRLTGEISIISVLTDALRDGFIAGTTADLGFLLQSTRQDEVSGTFGCVPDAQSSFSSPALPKTIPGGGAGSPGSAPVRLPVTCRSGTAPGSYDQIEFRFDSATSGAVTIGLDLQVVAPQPPPPLDSSIVWEETTDRAILVDGGKNAWSAGRLKDILLRADATFVASSTGGVWGINVSDPDAPAGCTTDDLDNPNFTCMAFGPDTPLQIYAGCSSLAPGTRPGTGLYLRGLEKWNPVPIVDAFGNPILTDDIVRILVLPRNRVILLATLQGVFMSPIPSGGGQYAFAPVASLPAAGFSGMCAGPGESVVVSRWGRPGGIFAGAWSGNQLTFTAASMVPDPSQPNGDIDLNQVTRTSLASCGADPAIMYAVMAGLDSRIYRILRSDSGGASWRPLRNLGERVATQRLAPLAPDDAQTDLAGDSGWYTNCIAVGFNDPNEVGIGWRNGPWLSSNASDTLSRWVLAYDPRQDDPSNPDVHADVQFILFDPGDPSGNTIYACSDGGLMVTRDRAGLAGYHSLLSKHIRNLQFFNDVPPGEKGTIGRPGCGITASPIVPGLIAGPTQDNGNLFCDLESAGNKAWQQLEDGDGLGMRFLSNGLLLTVGLNDPAPLDRRAKLSAWNGTAFGPATEIPVTSPAAEALSVYGDAQPVSDPSFALAGTGKLLFAVAAAQNAALELRNVYGLFMGGDIASAEWQLIATLPLQGGDAISSVASLTGHQVFAGTQQGRIFSLAPFQDPFELTVSPADKGAVHDITIVREDDALAFALYDGPTTKAILQSDFFSWDPLGNNDNVARGLNLGTSDNFIAMAIDRVTNPPTLYACTDKLVYVSRDEGDTWLLATRQLPSRAHCTSFALGAPRASGRYLYLSTYGRSVWQAKL